MSLADAIEFAQKAGMDLVQVSEQEVPFVKPIDMGKQKFDNKRKQKGSKTKKTKLKEVKFSVNIGDNDYATKLNKMTKFLGEGHKLRASLLLKGRQVTHSDLAIKIMDRIMEDLAELMVVESKPSFEGRVCAMVMTPAKSQSKKQQAAKKTETEIENKVESNDAENKDT